MDEGNNAKGPPPPALGYLALLIASFFLLPLAHGQAPAQETVVLPASVPDPLEPFNRVMWGFNKGLLTDVVKPTARVYRFAVRKPVRTGIGNMGRNLNYPDRVINNMLQGSWTEARDESLRFLCNSTVGVAGFFDVASRWRIPKTDVDFGQTFGQWGWRPDFFLMLPFYGPSNDRDTVGLAADTASNPLAYLSPYTTVADNPLTWVAPYTYFTWYVKYNDISDAVNEEVRFSQAEMDPYAEIQYAWTFFRENRVANFRVTGQQDPSSLETLESVFFTYKDPDFPQNGKTRSVVIPSTGRRLRFTYWLQPGKAPIIYIIPGLGAHRMAETALALAELMYRHGYSALTISSPFNSEFMDHASTTALPGYLPADARDLQLALTAIDQRLTQEYRGRLAGKALVGYSMGAFEALYLASAEATGLKFDRYLAINTPVRLLYGVSMLDKFYDAPLQWPAAERIDDMENTLLKGVDLSKTKLTPKTNLPFNAIESKFLIGLVFRFTLRDIIYTSQRRYNQGILQEPLRKYRRAPVYHEIMQYSYRDYFDKFVVPYYRGRGLAEPVAKTLDQAGDLRTYQDGLRVNPKIRVIANENDFLLGPEDIAWLHATFPPQQLTIFPRGGHLGNLHNAAVQKTILEALSGLR